MVRKTGLVSRIVALLFLAAVVSIQSGAQSTSTVEGGARNAALSTAAWQPKFEFDDQLFPSFVLATSGPSFLRSSLKSQNSYRLGDPLGLAEISIRPEVPNSKVHVEIEIEGLTRLSSIDVNLPDAGQEYTIAPLLDYDYMRLSRIDQAIPAIVTYSVHINGVDLGQKSTPIRVRSVNDVPFAALVNGKEQDFSVLFAAYVNENHPFVESVLQEALRWRAVDSFNGYQSGPDNIRLQVFAIWNVLQRHHLHYSNITTPSADSPTGIISSQAVRFIDQSIASQQANCVDGSVLFASILYKIGIFPVLVMKPGHMFIGYALDVGHTQFEFLETTMMGAGHQPGTYNLRFSPILHPVASSESWREFLQAREYANNVFLQEVLPAIQRHDPGFRVIDIAAARQAGVNAIPR